MHTPNDLHQELLKARTTLSFACAGAGAAFISSLWRTPGSSTYLGAAHLLQARTEFDRFLGFSLEEPYCSAAAALDLATASFLEATRIVSAETPERQPMGVGLTATVATDRVHRGDLRAFIAVITPTTVLQRRIVFEKLTGEPARLTQDRLIAEAIGTLVRMALENTQDPEMPDQLAARLHLRPRFLPDGRREAGLQTPALLFPANFNPPHAGHKLAREKAETITGQVAELSIEANPPHKPALSPMELLRRVGLVQAAWPGSEVRPIQLTFGQSNYVDKAKARPGSAFIAGADAVARLFESQWGYEVEPMLTAMAATGAHFYVLGRPMNGRILALADLPVPPAFASMFIHLEGAVEASSTAERSRQLSA